MKRNQHTHERLRFRKRRKAIAKIQAMPEPHDRAGSTIVVVLVLMMGLLFLGMLLFTEASQENVTAEYYASAGKDNTSTELDPEPIFEASLRQIVLGANNQEFQSPFYSGMNSLLPRMFGPDRHLFSGEGVNLSYNAATPGLGIFVDQDRNNSSDPNVQHWLQINQSPAATGEDRALQTSGKRFYNFPGPDVDYVYLDHTSTFLSYNGPIRTNASGVRRVRLGSYSRPQLLRGMGIPASAWYTNSATAARVMRPHREHFAILSNGQVATTPAGVRIRRFVSPPPPSGPDPYSEVGVNPLSFAGMQQGVWTEAAGSGTVNTYNLQADPDGDGVNEAVYLDFDLPMFTTPDGSQTFIPMIAVTVRDMDALMNVNATGNSVRLLGSNGLANYNVSRFRGSTNFISQSHQATSRSELNPQWALYSNPATAGPTDFAQHRYYFGGDPMSPRDVANMEWWWLLTGRPEYQAPGGFSNITGLVSGRWGESNLMKSMLDIPANNLTFPRPGATNADDNNNRLIGRLYNSNGQIFPLGVQFPAYGHPADYRGRGNVLLGGSPTQRDLRLQGRHRFPKYNNYFTGALQDEPWETRLWANIGSDSTLAASDTAALHMSSADRTSSGALSSRILKLLPYSTVTSATAQSTSRKLTAHSWDPKSFSKTFYGNPAAGFRRWEFTQISPQVFEFPPTGPLVPIGTSNARDPFRSEVRELIRIRAGDRASKRPQRRLSINGFVDRSANGSLRIRPLTPHPTGIPSDVISGGNSILNISMMLNRFSIYRPEQIGNDNLSRQRQEWLARYDRQRMCRDIYTMLYMFGGGNNVNYRGTDNANNSVYTDSQMREMAQLAVNWVDALDPDDTITKFEYDKNLGNGYHLNDDPYDFETGLGANFTRLTAGALRYNAKYPEDSLERGVVYGVEAQKLSFSETMAVVTKEIKDATNMPFDHPATHYDDKKNRRFTFIELQNVSPNALTLANDAWQIVIKNKPGLNHVIERRLTLQGNAGQISAPLSADDTASRFTIATMGDIDNRAVGTTPGVRDGNLLPSFFRVNPLQGEAGDMSAFSQIAPKETRVPMLPTRYYLDLLNVNGPGSNPNGYYRMNAAPAATAIHSDGRVIPHNVTAMPNIPSGIELLKFIELAGDGGKAKEDSILNGGSTVDVVIQLRRRANLNRVSPRSNNITGNDPDHVNESRDNPWVLVDESVMRVRPFNLGFSHKGSDVQTRLRSLASYERRQPLSNSYGTTPIRATDFNTADPDSWSRNTLGNANRLNPSSFSLWQPHFDRDFTSVTELFNLPIYGPEDRLKRLGTYANPLPANPGNPVKIHWRGTANDRFLRPDRNIPLDPNRTVAPYNDPNPTTVNRGNRWYRLLELFEVPEPTSSTPWLADYVNFSQHARTAGKINLNTMRHPAILAGVLDDPNLTPSLFPNGPTNFLSGGGRTWWHDFLRARDGIDPMGTGLTLPGVPGAARAYPGGPAGLFRGSRPFRNLGYSLEGENSLEHTVLRSREQDGTSTTAVTKRRLFEVGSPGQHTNRTTSTSIDYTTRSRLLQKVMNNTTNRSNVFVIFLQIDYFEAKSVVTSTGERVNRIGRKLATSPSYRKVYVVDRSKAMDIVKQTDLPQVQGGRFSYSLNQNLNFSPLILHQQRIR